MIDYEDLYLDRSKGQTSLKDFMTYDEIEELNKRERKFLNDEENHL
jgi:hypothetical protein